MPTILIQTTPGVVPEGFCPAGEDFWQEVYELFLSLTQYSIAPPQAFYNYGNVVPTPENRVYPWIRQVGGYPDRTYQYAGGQWLAKHPLPVGFPSWAPENISTQAQLDTYDEGTAGTVSQTTGPFWEIDTTLEGRVIIGAGNVPGSTPALVLSVASDTGAGSHVLVQAELPLLLNLASEQFGHRFAQETLAPFALAPRGSGGVFPTTPPVETANYAFDNVGGGTAMSLLPPARVRLPIKRTNRIYFAV